MDDSDTLRGKAARCYESAARAASDREAKRLNDLARQLEMWADDLDRESGAIGKSHHLRLD
jgi:hypothetical protein